MHFRNIFWNMLGLSLPLLIAALTVPKLLTLIGSERFGFLALAWGLIGYSGALDLGIGRATTHRVSVLHGTVAANLIPDVVATAIRITLITGGLGMLIIIIAALSGVYNFIHAENIPNTEIEIAMLFLALALPMQAISATYRGVNEAYLNFKSISILRMILGAANFGAPYLVAFYTKEVHWLVATLVISRGLALVFFRQFAHECIAREGYTVCGKYTKHMAQSLLQFGGWFTVSSVIGPLIMQADRFFVGVLISASAVTLYALPYEMTVQATIVVGAITTVAFPVISNLIKVSPQEVISTFHLWLYRVSGLMLAFMIILAYAMPYLLRFWIGPQVEDAPIKVGQILCVGVFFNAIGTMYFSLLHAYGKTKMTAFLHMIELPFFVVILYISINHFGVIGAAVAWTLRAVVEMLALMGMARNCKMDIVSTEPACEENLKLNAR